MIMVTGKLCRNKKFNIKVEPNKSKIVMCGLRQTIPQTVKEYEYGFKRRKQLTKALLIDMLKENWISHKDFVDFIMGEELIHKLDLLALVSTFNKDEYKKE